MNPARSIFKGRAKQRGGSTAKQDERRKMSLAER